MALTQARAAGAFTGGRYGSFAGRGAGGGAHPVEALTQPRGHGAFTGKRYGSFAGRAAGSHPVDALTQPRAFGAFTGKRYGSFAGRSAGTSGPHPVVRLTQPRAFGAFTGARYGSFAGRTSAPDLQGPQTAYYGGGKSARELDLEGLEDRVRTHWEHIETLRASQAKQPLPPAPEDQPQSVSSVSSVANRPAAKTVADAYALGARTEEEAALLLAVLELELGLTQRPRDPHEDLAIALLLAAEAAQDPPIMAA